jgi:hypothetical protein
VSDVLSSLLIRLGLDPGEVRTGSGVVRSEMRGIQAEANTTQTTLSKIGTSAAPAFASIQHAALDTAKTLGVAFGAFKVGEFVGDAIKAAQDEEAGIARLDAAIKANVSVRGDATTAIERQIKANEDLGFSDDATRDSLTGLVAATHDVNQALAIQNTAMDLARFKHISLEAASDALVKVEGGRFKLLASLGIQLQANATKEQALAAVQAVAAGQAADFANTTAGAGQAAAAAFQDAQEALGTALLPLLKEAAGVAKNDLAPALHDVAGGITDVVHFGNDLAGVFNEIVALGPKVHDAIFGARPSPADIAAENAALQAATAYSTELRRIDIAIADGTLTQEEAAAATTAASDAYRVAIGVAGGLANANGQVTDTLKIQSDTALTAAQSARDLSGGYDLAARASLALTVATGLAAGASSEQQKAAADAMAVFKEMGTVFDGFNGTVSETSVRMGLYSADLDNTAMRAIGLKANTDALRDSLLGLPTDIQIGMTITQKTLAEGAGARNVAEKVGAAADPASANDPAVAAANSAFLNDQAARDKAAADARAAAAKAAAAAAKSAADQAAADAKRAAEKAAAEQAAAYRERLSGAFDAVRHAAEKYFDALHTANLKAINDAHDHANALLDAQKAANTAPVTEAQKAQEAIVAQRELAQRQADLAAAQAETGVDPAQKAQDIIRAQQALADLQAGARIAALQANADTANAAIDVEKAKNDALAATATQAENDRATAQRDAFANDLKALEASLSKHPETWAKTQQDILKLLMGYGVDYKKAAQNLGDQFAAGLVSKTRAAEEAANALANAAGGKLGATPKPVGAGTGASSAAVAASLGEMTLKVEIGPIQIDGEDVTTIIERRMAARFDRVGSGIGTG